MKNNEVTLAQRRLHWAIWMIPLVPLVMLGLFGLLSALFFHLMRNFLAQIAPQAPNPFESWVLILLLFPFVVAFLTLLMLTLIRYQKSDLILTNQRLIYRTGLLARISGEFPLDNIEAIILVEPILGRLLRYGTVMVTTLGGLRLPFHFIGAPQEFHATLQNAVQAAKSRPTTAPSSPASKPNDDSRYMPKS